MARGSPDYNRLVRDVIDEALIATWARNQLSSPRTERRSQTNDAQRTSHSRTTSPTLPQAVKEQVHRHNGKPICLRFQTTKGCDFPGCKHAMG
jgi:hypothetical protein